MGEVDTDLQNELSSILQKIYLNLELNAVFTQSLDELKQLKQYFYILKLIIPDQIEQIENVENSPKNTFQNLIDLLQAFLNMDLSHIKGALIDEGNVKHLQYFLEIMLLVTNEIKSVVQKDKTEEKGHIERLLSNISNDSTQKPKTKIRPSTAKNNKIENAEDQEYKQQSINLKELLNIDIGEFIVDKINEIRFDLRNLKKHALKPVENEEVNKLVKQKESYKLALKDYYHEEVQKVKKADNIQELAQKNIEKKIKNLNYQNQKVSQELKLQEQSMFYQMRDDKIRQLRRIHKMIFDQEKQKILSEKKLMLDLRKNRNEINRNAIDSLDNQFKDKIQILKNKLKEQKVEKEFIKRDQIKTTAQLERELKEEKEKQLKQLNDFWKEEQQRLKFVNNSDIERKIIHVYKKY